MVRDTISCRTCGDTIGPHWQTFEHATCQPGQLTRQQNDEYASRHRQIQERTDALATMRAKAYGLVLRAWR